MPLGIIKIPRNATGETYSRILRITDLQYDTDDYRRDLHKDSNDYRRDLQ